MNYLLHAELVERLPIIGQAATEQLQARATETLVDSPADDPNISVVIRNFNEASKIETLLQDLTKQVVGGEVEIIVVDNESTDNTKEIVAAYGAKIVSLPRSEFTYPRSMNLGMEAASHNTVFLTVAHVLLATTYTLHAGARHFKDNEVAGAFFWTNALPSYDASKTDQWMSAVTALDLFRGARQMRKATMGVMGATGAMLSKKVWRELGGFDERYKTGGEDTALARKMLTAGYRIIKDPGLAVHHSHGLKLLATVRDLNHQRKTAHGPQDSQIILEKRRKRIKTNAYNPEKAEDY